MGSCIKCPGLVHCGGGADSPKNHNVNKRHELHIWHEEICNSCEESCDEELIDRIVLGWVSSRVNRTGFLSTGPSPPSHLWHAADENLLKSRWGPTTKTPSGFEPYLKQVRMAEGNVANSNGLVMGKSLMDLSTLL